jgi:hypothetical protein
MATFKGAQEAKPGLYLNLRKFSLTVLDRPGQLPGVPTDYYRRVPMLLMLLVAPFVGLAYVMFLPFIGFAAVAVLATEKVREGVAALAQARARRAAERAR